MKSLRKLLSREKTVFSELNFEETFNAGETLKNLRLNENKKQKEIYEGNNVSQSFISNIEKGDKRATFDVIKLYSDKLGIDYSEVLTAILEDYRTFLQSEAERISKIIDIQSQKGNGNAATLVANRRKSRNSEVTP